MATNHLPPWILRMRLPAEQISLGTVVRSTKDDFALAECRSGGKRCVILAGCPVSLPRCNDPYALARRRSRRCGLYGSSTGIVDT
jgi:hypothetical protein